MADLGFNMEDMLRDGEQVIFYIDDTEEGRNDVHDDSEEDAPGNEGNRALSPNEVQINDHKVFFPGPLNSRHSQILEGCLCNILEGKNTLLECPSDKERSLALLAVVLAYQQHIIEANGGRVPMQQVPGSFSTSASTSTSPPCKIYYVCRSVEEINQVVKYLNDFKCTGYLENLSMAILAHPTQLCATCQDDFLPCSLPANAQAAYKFIETNGIVHDLDYLRRKGESVRFCPYRYNMEISTHSTLVFCTQQFLLSQNLRTKFQINLEKAIVIIDDGGNIENACYKEASVSVTTENLASAGELLKDLAQSFLEVNQNRPSSEVREVASSLSTLAKCLSHFSSEINIHARGSAYPDSQKLLDILKCNEFDQDHVTEFIEYLTQSVEFIETDADIRKVVQKYGRRLKMILVVDKFLTSLQYMHGSISSGQTKDFAMQINKYVPRGAAPANRFELACVNATNVIEPITRQNPIIIISSACLPPVSILRKELSPALALDQDSEVLIPSQDHTKCFFGFTSLGPNRVPIELTWPNKDRATIHVETGDAILTIASTVPNGIVVSFPSIAALQSKVDPWKNGENRLHSIWDDLKAEKHVFCELDFMKVDDAKRQLAIFRGLCKAPIGNRTGAILLALHRERVSELMDFEPGEVRAFISLGIPYHSIKAFHITTKESFIHSKHGEDNKKRNNLWYNGEAFNNQNQKFSHCIRKEQDWVVGIILDDRMERKVKDGVTEILNPTYMEREWKGYPDVTKLVVALDQFIRECDVALQ